MLTCLEQAELPCAVGELSRNDNAWSDAEDRPVLASDFPGYARVFWAKDDLLREGVPVSRELALSYMAGETHHRLSGSKVPNFKAYVSGVRLSGAHYARKVEFAQDDQGYGFYRLYVRPEMGAGTGGKPSCYRVVVVFLRKPTVKVVDASCQCVAG